VPRAGFEHATTRSSAERSPRLSYLGTDSWDSTTNMSYDVLKFSERNHILLRLFEDLKFEVKVKIREGRQVQTAKSTSQLQPLTTQCLETDSPC
jgi:hypothetical protein